MQRAKSVLEASPFKANSIGTTAFRANSAY
jgi:hypothetical protein